MNLQDFRTIVSQVEESMFMAYLGFDGFVFLRYSQGILSFAWRIGKSDLIIKRLCECKNTQDMSVCTTYSELDSIAWETRDSVDTEEFWLRISPEEIEINIGEFQIIFIDVVDEIESQEYSSVTYFDSVETQNFLAAASVAFENGQSDANVVKFPQLRGININCFSDIIEIASLNMTTVMYRYIYGKQKVERPISFTISPEVVFMMSELMPESNTVVHIQINQEYVCLKLGNSVCVVTPIIRGVFAYPRFPMNNVGSDRLSVDREELLAAVLAAVLKKPEYQIDDEIFESKIFEQIKIQINGVLGSIEDADGIFYHFKSERNRRVEVGVWLDGKTLCSILQRIVEKEVHFIVPDHNHQGIIIETDKCQYVLLPLIKGRVDSFKYEVMSNSRAYLRPDTKVLFTSPGLKAGEPNMQISMAEVPDRQYIFSDWFIEPVDYDFSEEYGQMTASDDYDIIEEGVKKLIDSLNLIYADLPEKEVYIKTIIDNIERDLEFELTNQEIEFGADLIRRCNSLLQQGLLLRSRLLQGSLNVETTYQGIMSFY